MHDPLGQTAHYSALTELNVNVAEAYHDLQDLYH